MFGNWLNTLLNGCANIYRWEGRRRLIMRNDSEHSFGVAVVADCLCRIEIELFNNKVDELKVLRTSLLHDGNEVCMGDIISTVKKQTPAMKKALEEVEFKLYEEKLEPIIPKSWRNDFKGYLLNPKENKETIEGKIVAAADNIDALNECIQEVRLGNRTFEPYLMDISNEILDIDLESARYFMKNCLLDFGLPMDSYGERVTKFLKTGEY